MTPFLPRSLRPPLASVHWAAPVAVLLATSGCAGSLMHADPLGTRRTASEEQATPPPQQREPVLSSMPRPEAVKPPVAPEPATAAERTAAQKTAARMPAPPPETTSAPILVTGAVPRKPKPQIFPDTSATIVFTVTPAGTCPQCRLTKITVSPTGEVLIELGHWDAVQRDWDYQHYKARVKRNAANAFAAGLKADRPTGEASVHMSGLACTLPTRDAGLTIQWLEFGRRDRLNVVFDCPASGDRQTAQRLRHAPDVLALRRIAAP